jgi:1,4-dihydroxy-2-naphthoate octaprenyltransferase
MGLKSFLKLVEIKTKVASITPFLLGSVFALYRYGQFNWRNFLLMLLSLLTALIWPQLQSTITWTSKKQKKQKGFGYEKHNAIVRDNLSEFSVRMVILILLILGCRIWYSALLEYFSSGLDYWHNFIFRWNSVYLRTNSDFPHAPGRNLFRLVSWDL